MQQPITEKVHLGKTVNPADNTKSMQSIDYSNDFKDVDKKMNKLTKLFKTGVMDADIVWYLTGILPLRYQGMIYTERTKKTLVDANYKDRQTLEFNIKLPVNHYMN